MPKFIDPGIVVAQTGLAAGQVVADFGCGSGFYVLPAAQIVGNSGLVYAIDVVEAKLAATSSIATQFGYKNIRFVQADLSRPLTVVPSDSCDLVVMGNILHQVKPQEQVLKNAYRVLKSGGKLLVVEWKKVLSPIGPTMADRVQPQHLEALTLSVGLKRLLEIDVDNYHYAEVFLK